MNTDEKLQAIALRLTEYFSPDAPVDIPALLFVAGLQVFGRPAAPLFKTSRSSGQNKTVVNTPGSAVAERCFTPPIYSCRGFRPENRTARMFWSRPCEKTSAFRSAKLAPKRISSCVFCVRKLLPVDR